MARGLSGKRVVIAGSRKVEEMSLLIEKQGGTASSRPLQGTIFSAEKEIVPELQQFIGQGADWVIFTTGIGTETLMQMAKRANVQDSYARIIREAQVAARGYKTFAALKRLGIKPVAVDDDGTTRGLIRALETCDFSNKKVMVQLHGESAPSLIQFLEDKGASVIELLPYRHISPDRQIVEQLCKEVMCSEADAVCFTTAIQVHSLFKVAREKGWTDKLIYAFTNKVVAGAVGKVTAEALIEEGVSRIIVPENERMGALVLELSRYFEGK